MFHKHIAYKDKEISFLRDFFCQIQIDFHFLGTNVPRNSADNAINSNAFVVAERSKMQKDPGRKAESN